MSNLNICAMNPFYIFLENYKTATSGFHFLAKLFILLILAWIVIAAIFAVLGTLNLIF
ncbi:hypothetical protein SAMN05878281_1197 [Salegentibacter salegens]|uniref:Uncharacterized protein n=1 Tax=Salegentibacter salegens TaxID=143223 RepID=A0A1M7K136_9FLAO|nr:hypothetical protein LY58_02580 [Salegentibacter salegens]SHM58925.1 hypothetical protein SAMN05878281_1197 [Salegentibacter salegens]